MIPVSFVLIPSVLEIHFGIACSRLFAFAPQKMHCGYGLESSHGEDQPTRNQIFMSTRLTHTEVPPVS